MDENRLREITKNIEKYDLTENEKKKLPGSFIKLPCGETHYELKGNGEPVVLVHGYATPYYIYDKVFDCLTEKGYMVLRYDLLGRGFSERVKGKYNPDLFARQLKELTDALIPDKSFFLMGTSMGGAITAAFTAQNPERVKKLFLLAPAGMKFNPPFYMKLSEKPLIGELLFKVIGAKILFKKCSCELIYSKDENDYYLEKFGESIRYKGFSKATLSSLRHTILNWDESIPNYKMVARHGTPVCTIWGTADKTMPYYQTEQMKRILPDMHLYSFENSGHIFVFDEGQRTCDILLGEMTAY